MRSQRNLKLSSILLCHLFLLCLIPTFVQGACTSNDQCGNPLKPICASGTCRACTNNNDCTTNMPGTAYCETTTGACTTACSTPADCTNSNYPLCSGGFCKICTSASDCTSNLNFGTGYVCNNGGSPCAASCTTYTDCTDPLVPSCDALNNYHCNSCMADPQCSRFPLTPYCLASVSCVECTANSHCASGTCSDYTCVCSSNSHCTQPQLSACLNNVCKACTADSDCTHISEGATCVSGTCEAGAVSASSSGDITDGDIIIGAVFGSIAGVVVIIIVVLKILSWRKQRQALQSNPHQKVKATSINTQSPSDLSPPIHSESYPIRQETDVKHSI